MGGSSSGSKTSFKPATTRPASGYETALMQSLGLGNMVTDAAIRMAPEVRTSDIPYLQETALREAEINARNSRRLEETLSPELSRIRKELPSQILSDLEGGPSRELSNMWLKQGLDDAIATGADTDSGFARSAIVDRTRSDWMDNRNQQQAKAAGILAANPEPVAGIDPGAIASTISGTKADNANARDSWMGNVLNFLGNQSNNYANAVQQSWQNEMGLRTNNTAAINASRAANANAQATGAAGNTQMWGNLAGAGIGALGSIGGGVLVAF